MLDPELTASTARRPRPAVSEDTRFFWDGAAAGEFRIQRCFECKALRHPPRPMCPGCQSLEWDYLVSAGVGFVYSFVVHHKPVIPWLESPFLVAVGQLAEGVRYLANVVGCPSERVHVGMPVRVTFEDCGDGLMLPQFTPCEAGEVP